MSSELRRKGIHGYVIPPNFGQPTSDEAFVDKHPITPFRIPVMGIDAWAVQVFQHGRFF
jgi:hypothetical protein